MSTPRGGSNHASDPPERPVIHHEYEEVPKSTPLGDVLNKIPLEEFLIKDKANAKEQEKNLLWFHGKITRETAVHILQENGNTEGLFLVRESTSATGDFVVSIVHDGQPLHFQIHCLGDFYYQLLNGPLFQGLDALVDFYREKGRGLLTRFADFCKGETPPVMTMRRGRTTPLHRAVLDGNLDLVSQILRSPHCSPVDARDTTGRTSLQDAAALGDAAIVGKLLDSGANVNCTDDNGTTALYTACSHNKPDICTLLLQRGADPTLRHHITGWVPLHEAAIHGHSKCVQELLWFGAPLRPRSVDNDTPLDLARKHKHKETITVLANHQPSCPKTIRGYWDHGTMDRNTATEVIQRHGAEDGQFLVRNFFVLSMAANSRIYNFEINKKNGRFFIDDGPYFETIEHLVDYYMHYDDGFHVCLLHPISPQINDSPSVKSPAPQDIISPYLTMCPLKNGERPPTPGHRPFDLGKECPLPAEGPSLQVKRIVGDGTINPNCTLPIQDKQLHLTIGPLTNGEQPPPLGFRPADLVSAHPLPADGPPLSPTPVKRTVGDRQECPPSPKPCPRPRRFARLFSVTKKQEEQRAVHLQQQQQLQQQQLQQQHLQQQPQQLQQQHKQHQHHHQQHQQMKASSDSETDAVYMNIKEVTTFGDSKGVGEHMN